MRHSPRLGLLQVMILVISLAACNFPAAAPATSTPLPPTPTLPPPTQTATPTPLPPTETPTLSPTATLAPPTALPATPTNTPVPTKAVIKPEAGAKFEGTFEGGELVFRINQISSAVIPKSVHIRKARCQEGKTLSDVLSFEPPPSYLITDGGFSIVIGDQLSWSGVFTTPKQARGTIKIVVKGEGVTCTIGPVGWIANAP